MMETTLGMEHLEDDCCQACIERDIPCVRYIEGANLQILDSGSACAWCRFHSVSDGCSKSKESRKRKRDSPGEEEEEEEEYEGHQAALGVVEVPARSAGNGTVNATTTLDYDEDREKYETQLHKPQARRLASPICRFPKTSETRQSHNQGAMTILSYVLRPCSVCWMKMMQTKLEHSSL
jgi:hypothetical protein